MTMVITKRRPTATAAAAAAGTIAAPTTTGSNSNFKTSTSMVITKRRSTATAAAAIALVTSLVGTLHSASATTGVTECTLILNRGAISGGPSALTSTLAATDFAAVPAGEPCTFDGGVVSLSHPMSLKAGDKFFSTGQLQLRSIEIMVDEINTSPRCGVAVGGRRYGLALTTYGDDSSKAKVGAIVRNGMVPARLSPEGAAAFWLGPYSSGLTGAMSASANATGTVLVAGGAAATPVFRGFPTVFGTFPPTAAYLAQAVAALAEAGARSVAGLWEDAAFTRGVCGALPALAERHGLALLSETEVPSGPTAADLDPVARGYAAPDADPDVVVTCVYDQGCAAWIAALRRSGWSPRAQVFTVCVGMDSFVESVGTDAQYMMGISPWDPSLVSKDAVVGWSASEFAELFLATTWRTPTYHSASGAASVSVIVQAIERADSFDSDAVASILATDEFVTLYGTLSFDDNGQSMAPSLFLQYDQDTTVQTVYPPDAKSGDLHYPMPTWEHRDCTLVATCETGSESTVRGKCQDDGACLCDQEGAVSSGIGADAACLFVPEEDMTHIRSALKILGAVLFVVQLILSLACATWAIHYRNKDLVRASQPLFLSLVCFGTLMMSLSIIPLGVQGEYRSEQEQDQLTNAPNPDIALIDAGCMAVPWLFSIGFSIVFSALFAKIWRIMLVLNAAEIFVRKTVGVKDVAYIMVGVIAVQAIILTCWQIIDPLLWQREVLSRDGNGYPIKSIGVCESEHALRYIIPLFVADAMMLLFALYLGFRTRNISTKYHEGTWITASVLSIFQILILAVPILLIVDNDTNAFYFVRVVVIFLSCSTVTMLIFFPKMYQLHFAQEAEPEVVDAATRLSRYTHLSRAPAGSSANNRSSNEFVNKSSTMASGTVSNVPMGDCLPRVNGNLSNISSAGDHSTSGEPSMVEAVGAENPDGDGTFSSRSDNTCVGTAALGGSTVIASGSAEDMATASRDGETSEVAASDDNVKNQTNV